MKGFLKKAILRFENNFFSRIVKRALGMMIPLILVGGLACALMSLPIPAYQEMLKDGTLRWLLDFYSLIYQGTFGFFSIALVIALSLSYAMELNISHEYMVMYAVVSLAAFAVQLNIGTEYFDADGIGTVGCFSALLVTYLSCAAYTSLRRVRWLTLSGFTAGMGGICVPAIQTFLPLVIIAGVSGLVNHLLYVAAGVHGCYEFINELLLKIYQCLSTGNGFIPGLFYTVCVSFLWFFGLHGSHILEPIAQTSMAFTGETIFSKPFYDVFVAMGGCGTTICVLIALLLFYRKERLGKLAGLASFTVIFNLNEMLTFGMPIILNPVLFLPFVLTPIVCYCISYAAVAFGWVPMVVNEVAWTVPIGLGGYLATGSLRGTVLQFVCIVIGVAIYFPFLKINQRIENARAKEEVQVLIKELQGFEETIERPLFLTRGDHIGSISRMLLLDLKYAIRNKELYMLYQPQVRADGSCMGAEALLRWDHPRYGMIYPPLIIYLAEEGRILPELEQFIMEEVIRGIAEIKRQYTGEFKVSVNFTVQSLFWDIEDYIDKTMEKYGVEPDKLWIEITEQEILLQTDLVVRKLNLLKQKGHRLLIDDFGMGHTSLLYLQSNYFDVVKLDGVITRPLLDNKTNQKIIASIVELGNELGVEVIAEYVETKEQQNMLHELGCNCYQGYLYSKPIPLREFISYIKGKNSNLEKA